MSGNAGGELLTKLYKKLERDRFSDNIPARLKLMNRYLRDPRNGVDTTRTARSSERGNMMKLLTDKPLTIKNFIKLINFLGIDNFELIVRVHHPNKTSTDHGVMAVRDSITTDEDDEPDDETE